MSVWRPHYQKDITIVEQVQHRALQKQLVVNEI